MRITTSLGYAATPEDVFAMLADPEFQAAKVEATHPLSHTESVTAKGEQTVIVTQPRHPTDGLPRLRQVDGRAEAARSPRPIDWSRASAADGSAHRDHRHHHRRRRPVGA